MRKKAGMIIALIIGFLVIAELSALFMLYRDIAGFQKHWDEVGTRRGELIYVALGDSAAQGLGASEPEKGYVGLIADKLSAKTGKSVHTINVSKSGAKVSDVLRDQLPAIKNLKPDLVTIEIGANNVASYDESQLSKEYDELLQKLPKGTFVANMPYFGSRPKGRPIAKQITETINSKMKNHPELHLVDLQTITEQRDSLRGYAADYFHPNDRAYKNWAEAFWKEIEKNHGQL